MGDDIRIDSNWIRPTTLVPPTANGAHQASAPTDQSTIRSFQRPDQLKLATQAFKGLADPLPSLGRISSLLSSSPSSRPKGTDFLNLPEDREFVQKAFKEAFGRLPSKPEFQKALDAFNLSGDRHVFLQNLVNQPAFQQAAKRVDHALQVGTPVNVPFESKGQTVLWPYPEQSSNGGPSKLSSSGDMNNFREYMAPFASYFGSGTRGSQMLWVAEQGTRGTVYPGSEATRQLGAIAQTLFWDLPTLQNSDSKLRQAGVGADLGAPATMIAYLQAQKQHIQTLMKQQDWTHDGPVHRQSARELLGMVDGALSRAQSFISGDRQPLQAKSTGPYGVYDTAKPLDSQPPILSGPRVESDPKGALSAAEAKLWQTPDQGERTGFYSRLSSYLLGE